VFSTTRRALGILGLTGSLVASLQIPGLVNRPPEVVSLQTSFRLPPSERWGALSDNETPVPVQCALASFTIDGDDGGAAAAVLAPFVNPRRSSIEIQEETATPHPLEVAEAEEATTTGTMSYFSLVPLQVPKSRTLADVAAAEELDADVLVRLNGRAADLPYDVDATVTGYRGTLQPYTVKSGDSIWSIARRHRIKMSVLIYLNAMKTTKIMPDTKLFVPDGTIDDTSMTTMAEEPWVRTMLEPAYSQLLARYGRMTSGFGWRNHPVTGKKGFHVGIDIAAPTGTAIKAWKSGVVEQAGRLGLMGNCVIVRHPGGFVSVYGHCSAVDCKVGDKVRMGQTIARVGKTGRATGTHLHFAIKSEGHFINPLKYLGS